VEFGFELFEENPKFFWGLLEQFLFGRLRPVEQTLGLLNLANQFTFGSTFGQAFDQAFFQFLPRVFRNLSLNHFLNGNGVFEWTYVYHVFNLFKTVVLQNQP
jgi:hypothetical protein